MARSKWIWDTRLHKLGPYDEYVPEEQAINAPIMVDRFYEGARATDGTDIGSRRKHRDYMRAHNLTTADDFKGEWTKAQSAREDLKRGRLPDKGRREAIARALYRMDKP